MFLIFKEVFREMENTMSIWYNKAKKSQKIERNNVMTKNFIECEEYSLDTLNVLFAVGSYLLIVQDKNGHKILELDCYYDAYDDMQCAKCNHFSVLLKKFRKLYDGRNKNKISEKNTVTAAKKAEADAKNAEKLRIKMMIDANARLRNA